MVCLQCGIEAKELICPDCHEITDWFEIQAKEIVTFSVLIAADDAEDALRKFRTGEWVGERELDREFHEGGEHATPFRATRAIVH